MSGKMWHQEHKAVGYLTSMKKRDVSVVDPVPILFPLLFGSGAQSMGLSLLYSGLVLHRSVKTL